MIRVNDKLEIEWRAGMTVTILLAECEFTHHHIVVSVNGTLVPKEEYPTRLIADGDQVLVVHILGGG
jgi:thiamine biosynthesis protein ThiS